MDKKSAGLIKVQGTTQRVISFKQVAIALGAKIIKPTDIGLPK